MIRLKPIYNFLRSVKLALILIAYIIITSSLATIIPQGRDLVFYSKTYPLFVYWLIITLKFNIFYKSVLFLVPVSLFFISLSTCTFHRVFTRLRAGAKRRFGPDIIHIGLLLLMVGAIITVFGRTENTVYLEKNGSTTLSGGYKITLNFFKYLTYKNNLPKDWLSNVSVKKNGRVIKNFTIEVNKPLKLGTFRIYQYNYIDKSQVFLSDYTGNTGILNPGYYFREGDATVYFKTVRKSPDTQSNSKPQAIFEEWLGDKKVHVFEIPEGGFIEGYKVEKVTFNMSTGLEIVKDPGVIPVIIAFMVILLGLGLTFIQKLGDNTL